MQDQAAITQLIKHANYVHSNADWSVSAEWWQQNGAYIASRDGQLQGFMVATCDPAPVAWLRTIVIGMPEPAYAMRKLLPPVLAGMRAAKAQRVACLSPYDWLDSELAKNGFRVATVIEEMVRDSAEIPTNARVNVLIRGASSADIAPIIALDKQAFADPIWWLSASQLSRAAQEAFSFTVAESAGKIVGYQMSLQESPTHAHIVRLSVSPAAQGHGIGTSLLAHTLRTCTRHNLTTITLNTQSDNTPSHHLYTRFGFTPTHNQFNVWTQQLS